MLKRHSLYSYLSILLVLTLLLACEESTDEPIIEDLNVEIAAKIFPDVGTIHTNFQLELSVVSDTDTVVPGDDLLIRFDYNADGEFDTEWLDSIPLFPTFKNPGNQGVILQLKNLEEQEATDTVQVLVAELVQVTATNTTGNPHYNIDWSRDGSNRVAFDMEGGEPGGGQSIWIVDYPGGTPVKISSKPTPGEYFFDNFPEWSPLGDELACISKNGLDIIDVDSGHRRTIVERSTSMTIEWSPDGKYILYKGRHEGSMKTMIYDLANDTSSVLLDTPYEAAWSPDGEKFAIKANPLQIINFQTGAVEKAFPDLEFGSKIDWSPDGQWLSLGFVNYSSLSVLNVETGEVIVVQPDGLRECWWPSWSEDGSLIGFEAEESSRTDIWASIWAIQFPVD